MTNNSEIFSLANPISIITNKDKNDLTRADLIKVMLEKNIEKITLHYTGIDGKIKELKIPVTNRLQAELVLAEGERVDGSSLFKGIVEVGQSDLYVVPLYRSAFINPFDNTSLDFVARFFDRDGNLASFVPDNILHKAANKLFEKHGYELHTLGELEFYLLGNFDNKSYALPKQKGYHASPPFAKTGHILNEMLKYMTQITGNVKYAHNEVGSLDYVKSDFPELNGKSAEQVEIEFLPTNVEDSADNLVIGSWIIRNVAYKHGFVATFFPKLEQGHAGNGLHIHMALLKNGKNIMTDESGELSEESLKLIGGLCHYAPSLTAFGNMVSASYLRLVPNQEAPTKVCWSDSNRSALIRVPLAWTKAKNLAQKINPAQEEPLNYENSRQTVELRSPDGSANAHLLLSGITMAVEWGLSNAKTSIEIAKMCKVPANIQSSPNFSELSELATSCAESSEKLLQQKDLYERDNIFPSQVINYVAKLLQSENDRYLNSRLLAMAEEEQIVESRRIMHRDIHRC